MFFFLLSGELDDASRAAKKSSDEANQLQLQLNEAQKTAKDRSDDVTKLRGKWMYMYLIFKKKSRFSIYIVSFHRSLERMSVTKY